MLTALVIGTVELGFLAFAFPRKLGVYAKWYGVIVSLA